MALTAGTRLGPYEVVSAIGAGGMGEVYRARDTKLDRDVAIKVLPEAFVSDPDRLERFQREARALARLNHPNVVTIHVADRADGVLFLVMELVEGRSLKEVLDGGALPLEAFFQTVLPVIEALAAAHAHGITHRDLKPANIMVTDETVKVLDFGLAKVSGDASASDQTLTGELTQSGVLLGTFPYMSPEQVQAGSIDHRSDVFSVGTVMYELLTGERPFQGVSGAALASAILTHTPVATCETRPQVPKRVSDIVQRCLRKSPDERYQSADDLLRDLRAARLPHAFPTGAISTPAVPVAATGAPTRPSIAVVPFGNLGGGTDQEFFADGITEDLITALSKVRWLFVIARNSSFAFKGSAQDSRQLAAALGVRYVLEGNVRQSGMRVRLSAQLVDADLGRQIWAERYDRDLGDVFALQDELALTVITAIEPELARAERERAIRRPPESLDAWSSFQRGLWHHYRTGKDDNAEARRHLRRAIEVDPEFSRALAALAHAHYWDVLFGYVDNPGEALEEGLALARRAVAADDREPFAHFALGRISTLRGDLDAAIAELVQAVELSPSFALAHFGLANALVFAGQLDRGIQEVDRALELDPHDPAVWTFMSGRALSLLLLQRRDEALVWARKGVRHPNAGWVSHAILAWVQAELDQREEARQSVAETLKLKPDFTTSFFTKTLPFRDAAYRDRMASALSKAGFPK